jgi:hypothetical protein
VSDNTERDDRGEAEERKLIELLRQRFPERGDERRRGTD